MAEEEVSPTRITISEMARAKERATSNPCARQPRNGPLSTELRIGYVEHVMPRVYLETSVVSYLVGRLSRDVIVLGNQELTREWWSSRRHEYEVFISEVVIGEASIGDPELVRQRLAIAADLSLLGITQEAERLAPLLLKAAGLASNAATDALHMAIATVNGMDYLLSWNCRHIANATIRRAIERQCGATGYEPPVILYATRVDGAVITMWEDPIVKETRAAREKLFAQFNHDLGALCRFLREKEREHSDRVVTFPPRRPEPAEWVRK